MWSVGTRVLHSANSTLNNTHKPVIDDTGTEISAIEISSWVMTISGKSFTSPKITTGRFAVRKEIVMNLIWNSLS